MGEAMVIILVIIGLFIGWGLYGGYVTKDIGMTCDTGTQGSFCLKWHTNPIGMFGQIYEEVSKGINNNPRKNKAIPDIRTPQEKMDDGITSCQPLGIVLSVSSDGGITCEQKNTSHGKQLIEQGYVDLSTKDIELINNCLAQGKNSQINPSSIICQ